MASEEKHQKSEEAPLVQKEKKVDIEEHLLNFSQIKALHKTDFDESKASASKGLSQEDAAARLQVHGPNVLTPPKRKSALVLYLECLGNLFNALLVICAILTWSLLALPEKDTANIYIGAVLFCVALLNAFIEFYQIKKSADILQSFLCTMIRNGIIKAGEAADLVPGDVVFVRLGDKVPADIYIIQASDFKVDNSSLTGESDPQERTTTNTHQNPLEANNLAFNGTLAVSGEAYGVVIRTGDHTVLGQIANLTQGEAKRRSPLSEEIERFVKIISTFAITSAIVFFIVAQVTRNNVNFSLSFAIGILVAWVPQGLPATVTMLLSIAAKRMAQKQVLVKDLQGVETLGAITLLATDKTGTLTRNQMTVTNLWVSNKLMAAASDKRQIANEEIVFDQGVSGVSEILQISTMCSRARFDRTDVPVDKRAVSGDATESGLLRFAGAKLAEVDKVGDLYPKVLELPFNSDTKWHMTIHKKSHATGVFTQFMKGAPERVLRICSSILIDGNAVPMTEEYKHAFQRAYEYMASKGHRVLAFAQNLLPSDKFPEDYVFEKETKNFPTNELCFVGLASLEDPPKHGVREAIGHCREAGVKVMMVTGDHPLTAEAIGRKINLMVSDTKERLSKRTGRPIESIREEEYFAIVIHGEKINELTDADWNNIFSKDEIIFARTSPKDKLEIVKRAQAIGHIVGVTGDGVNDSPALKKADLGIAMNQSGSDVSKEAASMILLDDNFASTVLGIAEGRLIFNNLKKSIQYVVTHSVPEIVPYLLNVVVPIPLGIYPLQIIMVDLGFELFAALSFAWEPPESKNGLMKLVPRKPVTPESILRLQKRNARKPKPAIDPESGKAPKLTIMQKIAQNVRAPFTKNFWIDVFEKPEGEILVDKSVLSWSYLEAGVIELVGCLVTFFVVLYDGKTEDGRKFGITPRDSYLMADGDFFTKTNTKSFITSNGTVLSPGDIDEALRQGQSAFYFGIFIIQIFNLFVCKCRYRLPFGLNLLKNPFTWAGIVAGMVIACFIVYVPPVNVVFNTSWRLSPLYWLLPMAFGFFLVLYATLRMLLLRKLRPVSWNPEITGLQMYPTRWSTGR